MIMGCQKTETIPTTSERLKAVQVKQETEPNFFVPRKSVDYMSDLKDIKDNAAKPEPARPVPAIAAKSLASSTPAPQSTSAPTPAPTATMAALSAPAPATAPPANTPARVAEPPLQVASAAPTARAAPLEDPNRVSVVTREQPEFPKEARRRGADSGTVLARLSINASGNVTTVAIVQARPARLFDSAVKESLSRWKFNPGADGRTYETEVSFKLQ